MYLRRINVNLYQDIKVLTHYCSTIGKPISGLDIDSLHVSDNLALRNDLSLHSRNYDYASIHS